MNKKIYFTILLLLSIIVLVSPHLTKAWNQGLGGWKTNNYVSGGYTWVEAVLDWTPPNTSPNYYPTYPDVHVGNSVWYVRNFWFCPTIETDYCDASKGGILQASYIFGGSGMLGSSYQTRAFSLAYSRNCGTIQDDITAKTSSYVDIPAFNTPSWPVTPVVAGWLAGTGVSCPEVVAPACDPNTQVSMSVSPNPGTIGSTMTFNLSGSSNQTNFSDTWDGGVDCSGGFGGYSGSKTCNALTAGDTFTWTHNWKNCAPGDCSITSAQCTKSINYSVDTPTCGDPNRPTLQSPANNTSSPNTTPTFTWSSVAKPAGCGSRTYQIQVKKGSTSGTMVINTSGITNANRYCEAGSSSCPFINGGIVPGFSYYWHVRATTTGGSSNWTGYWKYTVPACPAPSTPTLLTPADNTVSNSITPTLDWSDVATPAGCASKTYEVQVNKTSTTGTNVVNTLSLANSTCIAGTTCPFLNGGIVQGDSYYWRTRATTTGGSSAWSAFWKYTVLGNVAPTIDSVTIDHSQPHTPNAVIPDDSHVYSVTFTGSDANGGGNITAFTGIIDYQGERAGPNRARGVFGWSSQGFNQNFAPIGTAITCTGGGQASESQGWGNEYVTLVPGGCSTSVLGNTRTVVINIRFRNPLSPSPFPAPFSDHDISGQVWDQANLSAGWTNFNTDFNFVLPPTSLSASCAGTNMTWTWASPIDSDPSPILQYYGYRLNVNGTNYDILGAGRSKDITFTSGTAYNAQILTIGDNGGTDQNSPLFPSTPVSKTCTAAASLPWWQVLGGDITALTGNITGPNTPSSPTLKYLMDSWTAAPPGLAIADGSISSGLGGLRNPTDWKATGSVITTPTISYTLLRDKITTTVTLPDSNPGSTLQINSVDQIINNSNARVVDGYTYLWTSGNLFISGPLAIDSNKIVLLADQAVTVAANINLTPLPTSNPGFFMLLSGDAQLFTTTIGKSTFSTSPDLEGIYFSQTNIQFPTSNPTPDKFLRIEGSVIGINSVINTRAASDGTNPATQYVFRPDQVVLIPNSASFSKLLWQEVAP